MLAFRSGGCGALQELSVMKFFAGSLAAGLILLAGGAQAQVRGPYMAASDVEAPYAMAPRPVPGPHFEPGPRYGYGPSLLPSTEVYSVLRDNGFSPLGIPRLRGFVYTIAAIDRGGHPEAGRLQPDRHDLADRRVVLDQQQALVHGAPFSVAAQPLARPVLCGRLLCPRDRIVHDRLSSPGEPGASGGSRLGRPRRGRYLRAGCRRRCTGCARTPRRRRPPAAGSARPPSRRAGPG